VSATCFAPPSRGSSRARLSRDRPSRSQTIEEEEEEEEEEEQQQQQQQ
jgi:hypothetical protein